MPEKYTSVLLQVMLGYINNVCFNNKKVINMIYFKMWERNWEHSEKNFIPL